MPCSLWVPAEQKKRISAPHAAWRPPALPWVDAAAGHGRGARPTLPPVPPLEVLGAGGVPAAARAQRAWSAEHAGPRLAPGRSLAPRVQMVEPLLQSGDDCGEHVGVFPQLTAGRKREREGRDKSRAKPQSPAYPQIATTSMYPRPSCCSSPRWRVRDSPTRPPGPTCRRLGA